MEYEAYQTSSAQKRLYLINQLYGDSVLYNINSAWIIEGNLDVSQLEKALKKLVERHETLRTCFAAKDGKVFQKVFAAVEVELKYDSHGGGAADIDLDRLSGEFVRPFDLDQVPLWRAEVIRLGPEKYILLFDIHHIIADGASMNVLINELAALYSGVELPPFEFQYVDFTMWQNKMFSSRQMKMQEEYWLNVFSGELPLLDFPYDFPRPLEADIAGRTVKFELDAQQTAAVNQLAIENKTTLYVVLLSVYNILLSRYTAQEDIVVGGPISGRTHKEFEPIIGMFVNTLALRSRPLSRMAFQHFLQTVSKNVFAAFNNQDYPFEMLIEKLVPRRHLNRNPLIDTMLALQNLPKTIEMNEGNGLNIKNTLRIIPYPHREKVAKFDLTLTAHEQDRHLIFILEYRTSLFREDTIERMTGYFKNIVQCVCENPHVPLAGIDILDPDEKRLLLYDFNRTDTDFPTDKTIHELFREQVNKTPDSVSVVGKGHGRMDARPHGNISITYRELNRKSDQVAFMLRERGVLADDIVAIMLERSLEMIVGILGILKAGGAYLPIDPGYPDERKQYMLADSGAGILLTGLPEGRGFHHSSNQFIIHHSGNLAYVIYTSGSTGKPKGVLIEHRSLVNLCCWHNRYYQVSGRDRIAQYAAFGFDASVWEVFPYLLAGAGIHIVGDALKLDIGALQGYFEKSCITLAFLPTQVCEQFMDADQAGEIRNLSLRKLLTGGDKLNRFIKQDYDLYNNYGPTENTVVTAAFKVEDNWDNIPIGRPVYNHRVYILNNGLQLQPIGVPGELCIAGAGVSRGYLNRPELTAEKFDQDLWDYQDYRDENYKQKFFGGSRGAILQKSPPGRRRQKLYKTGDRARWLSDGNIQFLGRMDRQVKLRGYRIEPGEIEQRLLDHEAVKEAAVIPGEGPGNEKFLCAYLAAREPGVGSRLREYLSKELPDYMIPSYFVELEKLPLTPSGKVNRNALPAPGIPVTRTVFTAPGSDVEKKLAGIWSEVLNIPFDSIGIDGNFFELGGHSLKAGTMVSRIHEALDIRVPLAEVFKSPTIRGLYRYIRKEAAADVFTSIEAGEEKEYYPLSSAQQRFFLLQQLAVETTVYNMPHILYPLEIDKDKLEETIRKLIQRHESLRTCFQMKDGELVQRIYPAAGIKFSLEYFHTANKNIFKNFIRPFNLSKAPLFRVGLIQTAQRNMLMVDIHHIVSDGTSQKVLFRDYESLYSGGALPPLRLQYRDFARWQHALIRTGEMKVHENYWRRHLEGPLPEINLPTDYPAPAVRGYEGHVLAVALEKEPVRQLHALMDRTGTTLYMVLLAAFNILLFKYTGQGDIIIGSPMASRVHADLEDIIGLVMESIMIRNFPAGEKTFMEFLEEVKQKTLGAIEHQVYPYSELEKKIGYKNVSSGKPITNVGLMVQNIFASGVGAVEERVFVPGTSKLDLTIAAGEGDGTVSLVFEYSTLLFKAETIERLAGHFVKILEEAAGNPGILLSHIEIISDREKTGVMGSSYRCYPLSHAQKRIYYTEKIYPDTPCNTLAFTVRYNKILDKQLLEQAINRVIRDNDSLRLRIVEFDFHHEPSQYIFPFSPLELRVLDFSGAAAGYEEGLRQWIEKDVRKPFRFFNNDLYYFAYIRVNEDESGFYMKLHHIAADGWAVVLLVREITAIYEALAAGDPVVETPNPSYIDYLSDEGAYLKSSRAAADREFWHNTLRPLPEEVQLFENKINTAVTDIKGAAVVLPFSDELRTGILRCCRTDNTSVFKLVLSALCIYISRVTGCDDAVIGGFNHNRTTDTHKKMSGMFVSTFPLRINVDQCLDFQAFVEKNGEYVNHILKNRQKYPFDRLAAELRAETGIDPAYLLNINLIGHPHVPGDKFRIAYYFSGYEPTPLSIHINSNNRNIYDILELEWDYQPRRCSAAEITRMHRCLVNILDDALSHPGKPLWAIELVSGKEKEEILFQFNDTLREYPSAKTVHRLVEEQAARNPGGTAVVSSNPEGGGAGDSLDYGELNERAARLAVRLRERGAGSDRIIGIMTDRSHYIIIGLLAILKSGAAFLPLDPSNPEQRIGRVLADSGAHFVLTRHHLQDTIPSDFDGEIMDMEDEGFYESGTESRRTADLPSAGGGSLADLAYVIYTSGSTGTPRGVMVSQGSYLNAAYAWRQGYCLQEMEVNLLQLANFTFDVFLGDAARVLVNGGKMVICSEEARVDPAALYALIREHHITLFESTPALILPLMNYIHENRLPLDCLKLLIVGSDICPLEDFKDLIGRFGDSLRILNSYGVTEATIDTLYYEGKTDTLPKQGSVPVGRPMPNMRVYILSSYGRLQPVGIAGELGIGGEGVARGYLNNPELTSEKFVFVSYRSYRTYISKKIYKTGDLARWLADGCIDFIGRKDQQVKIRGFRIEPGEVRSLLLKQPPVKDAVVASLGNETGDRYLCAYIVPADSKPGEGIDVPALKSKLSRQLPAYMVPGFFVTIEEIPLTVNGKIDMKALPVPGVGESGVGDTYIAPGNRREEILAAIWSEVLGVEKARISITGDFFELGGHSLKASLMLSKVHRQLEVKIPLAEIFVKSTIRELAQYIKSAQREHYDAVEAVEKKEYYPLSSAQKRLYILQQIDDIGGIGYNMPVVTVLEGQVNKTGLGKIFKKLIRRHEIFRTSFELAKDQPVQRIGGEVEFAIEYFNLAAKNAKKREEGHLIEGFIRPFDLSRAPLLRVGLIKKQAHTHILMLDMHHIITDGLSVTLFIKEFMAFYGGEELAGLKLQYKDYAEWQNGPVQKQALGSRETYWVNRFREEIPLLHLPCDYKRPLMQSFEGDTINFIITGKEAENLKALAPGENVTLYMVLLAIFNILLSKLSGSETIIIGTPVSGRRHEDFHSIIGMFVNTLALQNRPAGEKTFHSFLREVKERTLEDFENQDYPFEELVDKVEVSRDTGRNPLFDVMFVFQDLDIPGIRIPGLKLLPYDYERRTAKFDMTLTAMEANEALLFSLEYCTKLFKEETIRRWITYFKMIVFSVLRNPAVKIGEIEIIGEEEKRRLLFDFNRREVEYPADKTIHELFREQAEKTPGSVAVVVSGHGCMAAWMHGGEHITYRELNKRSAQVAQALKERGVLADDIVGIKMERSLEMIIGILGIIKAGGAYLPIDPDYPQHRIDYMLKDSNAALLLTSDELSDVGRGKKYFDPTTCNLYRSLAYVIYTSGSTGRPKGTMIDHGPLVNRLNWMQKQYAIDENSTLLQKTPFTFDVSVWEIFWWALAGARLCISAPGAEKDPAWLVDTIELNRVSVIHFVPSMLNVFLDYIENTGKAGSISALRQVIASGEALTVPQVCRFSELIYKRNGTKLANLYGPTEATIDVSYYDCDMEKEIDMVPIGKPIDNIRLYIINNNFQLQPVGVTGELCIAGIGLARGYLNKPGLTAGKFENYKQAFKQKFFGGSRGAILQKSPPGRRRQKIYLTGDLARWMVDGDIEFLGRKDGQVKVRGFRIELAEIENKLSGHERIREVVVLAREDAAGDKYLCAYVVPAVVGDIDTFHGELQGFLSQYLPEYMIPSYLVELESIPLTANGKINRKALPEPKIGEPGLLDAYIAPRNRREDILAAVWSEILGIEKQHIGIDSNFFKLGGHSLKAALMVSKVHRRLNVKIPLAKVFVKSTIRELAGCIEAAQKEYVTPIKKAENKLFYPLSSAQKRLYVLQQMNPGSTGYNIPTVVALEGELNIGQMDLAFRKLVKRHESFRTSFPMISNKPVQRIHLEVPFVVEYYDITVEWGAEVEKIAKNFIRPFDLSRPPLLRVGIIKTGENKHVLMVDMHHIISDGLSMEIFIREFVRFYDGLELPPLDIQYKDFARWQDRERERGVLKKQEEFWLSRFAGEIPELNLPFDYPEPPVPGFAGSRFGFEVDRDLIIKIKEVLSRTGTTLHQFLLAVYNILLSRYTRQEDIVVGYPVTGRSHADLQPIIGMFVNMLPMRNRPRGNKTFRQFLEEVRENAFNAHENQDYPFEDLVVQLGLQGEAGGNPLFNAAFALHTREGKKTDGAEGMLKVIPVEFEHKVSIFAVTLRAYEAPGSLSMVLEYKTALFKRSTMEKYAKRYIEILEQVVENIHLQLKDILVSHKLLALKTGVFAGEEGDFRF